MSAATRKMLGIQHATRRFEAVRALTIAAIERHDSRICLDAFVELLGLYVEQTGGTLTTVRFRDELATLRARVESVPVLSLLPALHNPQKEPSTMLINQIETAVSCLFCGAPGVVGVGGGGDYEARCSCCYEGDEEAGPLQRCRGMGETLEDAVADWHYWMEEEHPTWIFTTDIDRQIAAENARQATWIQFVTPQGLLWAPASYMLEQSGAE